VHASSEEASPLGGTSRWRVAVLPLAAALALVAGVVVWIVMGAAAAQRVFFVGLVVTGAPAVWQTAREMLHGRFASDIVAMLAIVAAVWLREPLAGLVVVLMLTGGQALERYAEGKASEAVRALAESAPRIAHRLRADGAVDDVAVDEIAVGDRLLVRPGELIPCDSVVEEGRSHVDTSRLTGEPVPDVAEAGTPLASGAANLEGAITVRATALARDSQYARIVELVRTAQASKAPIQRLADRYAVWFTPATLLVCAVAWLASGDPVRVLAVLVVATPCPMILATPIAIIGGIDRAAARQIIIRRGSALEQLAEVTAVVFDKTGTLTIGRPELAHVSVVPGWDEARALRLAGALEQHSSHLLARSTAEAALRQLGALPTASHVTEVPGRGVVGCVDGHDVAVGSRRFVLERAHDVADAPVAADVAALEAQRRGDGSLCAYVMVDGRGVAALEYADRVRGDAADVVGELQSLGIGRAVLLSGDHDETVQRVAGALGIPEARGDLLASDKADAVRALIRSGERVAMVGDGTNDAPALSGATIGVALAGSAGHGGGITAEAADVVILADSLARVPEAIRVSRRTLRVAKESLFVGLGLSAVAMIFAALGYVPPVAGALLQEGIDVAVILNALRARGGGAHT